jgi:hypothetical protein
MARLVADALSDAQRLLIEPPNGGISWPSQLWSPAEVLRYLNENNRRFFLDTGAVILRDISVVVFPSIQLHTIPDRVMVLYSVAFFEQDLDTAYALCRSDRQAADLAGDSWATNSGAPFPLAYSMEEFPSQQLALIPPSNLPGVLELLFVPRPGDLLQTGAFTLPDELAEAPFWGMIADMLETLVGGSESPEKSQYARLRQAELIAATQLLIQGWA